MKRSASDSLQNIYKGSRAPRPVYPFTAIVGQEEMKLALLLNVVDSLIGGVLIMGHRGTAKSTAVRALADLLPLIWRARSCHYGCDPADVANLCDECHARLRSNEKLLKERAPVPVVDLPLGATEDRVCGTINIERALTEGVKAFEPGLLARAHRGFLYIDEVNLLEDHLIDLLLDVSVTGRNVVEREGISVEHPAQFVLVGSGNPEEGELRPQLLDRFGLHVEVKTAASLDERVQIVERREAFERDPEGFRENLESEQQMLRRKITRARKNLGQITLDGKLLRRIAELCQQLNVDGHRGELIISRASRALAAFEGRKKVSETDVRRVAAMALRHRLRRDPLEQAGGGQTRIEQKLKDLFGAHEQVEEKKEDYQSEKDTRRPLHPTGDSDGNGTGGGARQEKTLEGDGNDLSHLPAPAALDSVLPEHILDSTPQEYQKRGNQKRQTERRSAEKHRTTFNARRGRYTRAVSHKTMGAHIALDATLRAAIGSKIGSHNSGVRKKSVVKPQTFIPVARHALRYKQFKQKAGTLFIFAIDASGSMALNRIAQAKGALVRLLQKSYVRRDRVALISFRGEAAELLLPPSGSVARARRLLDEIGTGGATPLSAGLMCALEVVRRARRQEGIERIVLLLFTDGRANIPLMDNQERSNRGARTRHIAHELKQLSASFMLENVHLVVVDTQNRFTSGGEAKALAELIGGQYVYLGAITHANNKLL